MTKHRFKTLATAAALAVTASAATAATYDFTYTFSGSLNVVAGQFDGNLQGDGNTILITGFDNVLSFNGIAHSGTLDMLIAGSGTTIFANLDGTAGSFIFTDAGVTQGFGFDTSIVMASYFDLGNGIMETDLAGGTFAVAPIATVPLPAAGLLLLTALAGTAALSRRKSTAPLAA